MNLYLSDAHRRELTASAISPDVVDARGYCTVQDPRMLPSQFASSQRTGPGMLIPIRDATGEIATYQFKPTRPRLNSSGKPIKYETAAHGRMCIDVPPASRPYLLDAQTPLWITEGAKKVDSAVSHGLLCVIGLLGVDAWTSGGVRLPDWSEIAIKGREVVIAFDSDVMQKESVRNALHRLSDFLKMRGARVSFLLLPELEGGRKCGLDDWFAEGGTVADLRSLVQTELPPTVRDWPDPVPLDPDFGPPFPIQVLSGTLGNLVNEVAEETQTPVDLPALVALGAISAAVGGRYEVRYRPSNWYEPVHVMITPVAEPGNRKSAVFTRLTRPLRTWEAERRERERPLIAEWESKRRWLEKQLAAAESEKRADAGRSAGIADSEAVRLAAVHDLEEHLKRQPVLTEVFTDDATPESVKEKLIEQGGALAVLSAESAYLSNVAGRYHNAPHLDTILNGHAGDPVRVSRRGRPTLSTDRACLTLCLMLQREVVRDLGRIPGFRQRGAAARLLPAFPKDFIGHRKTETQPVSVSTMGAWDTLLRRLLEARDRREVAVIDLEPEAESACTEFLNELEPRIKSEGRDMQGWLAKLGGSVLRIAGLLHLAWCADAQVSPAETRLSGDTMRAAIALGRYFHGHARIMYRLMYGREGLSEAGMVLEKLRELDAPVVTRRDLHQRLRRWPEFQNPKDLDAVLEILEDKGWIRVETPPVGKQGGRPSPRIVLNPAIGAQNTQNSRESALRVGFEGFAYESAGDELDQEGVTNMVQFPVRGAIDEGESQEVPQGWVEV